MDVKDRSEPAPDLLTLRQLEMISVAGSSSGFSAAAKRLGISQPTLSAAIARIEQQLAARLFDRTTRRVTLTPEGESFAAMATELVAAYRAGSRRLRARSNEVSDSLTLVCLPSIAASIIPEALAAFLREHPATIVKLHDTARKQALELVIDRLADFAIVSDPPELPELRQQALCRDQFMVVTPSSLAIAKKKEIAWGDLETVPFALVGNRSARVQIEQAWLDEAHVLKPRFTVEQVSTALAMAAAGLCCTLLPRLYLTPALLGDLRAIPLRARRLERDIKIVHRNDRPLGPTAIDLLGHIKRAASAHG